MWRFRTCSFGRARFLQVTIRGEWRTHFWRRLALFWRTLASCSSDHSLLDSGVIFLTNSVHQIIEQFPVPSYLLLTLDFELSRHFGYDTRGQGGEPRREIRLKHRIQSVTDRNVKTVLYMSHVTDHVNVTIRVAEHNPSPANRHGILSTRGGQIGKCRPLSPPLPLYHLRPCPQCHSLIRPFP